MNTKTFRWNKWRGSLGPFCFKLGMLAGALLLALTTMPARAASILYVVSADPAPPGDASIGARLVFLGGHNLTYWAATDSGMNARARLRDEATTNNYDLVIVSESISSANVADAFKNLGKPVIVMEWALFDDMAMAGAVANDSGQTTLQTQVEVTNATHPLAGGLSGPVTVYEATMNVGWGRTLGTGAVQVATVVGAPTNSTIFAYEAGSLMVGMNAPARRVGFFLFGFATQAEPVPYTADAFTLVDAAVAWALQPSGLTGPSVIINSPVNGATFPANANITISVQAQDAGGSVSNVTFHAESPKGKIIIGQATSAPFSFTWNSVPDGNYILTAVATDTDGLSMNSRSVAITVGTPPKPLLFAVNNLTLPAGDAAVSNILHSMGIEVQTKLASASSAADAEGKLAVLISSTISSGAAAGKFREVTVPVITWESFIYDDMSMAGFAQDVEFGTTNGQTQVEIVNASHPMAAGLSAGLHTVVSTATPFAFAVPASGATVVARVVGDPGKAVIFGYDTGAEMADGFVAPARRVGLFIQDLTPANLTTEGRRLFDAAVNWALNRMPPTVAITSPAAGATFPANANITLQAQAQGAGGTVTNVQFQATTFQGTETFGEDSTAPYEIIWSSVAEGRYTLTALAQDNAGFQTLSAPVNIVVGSPPEPLRIFFVGNTATPPWVPDAAVIEHLAASGNIITYRGATANNDAARTALTEEATTNNFDLVIVSESITSGNVGTAFRNLAKPVVVNEAYIFDDMAMTGTTATEDFGIFTVIGLQTNVTIIDPAHPLAAGLSGDVTVYEIPTSGCYGRTVGSGAIKVATMVDQPEHLTIFAYEEGAQMVGMAAPARRVGFFLFAPFGVVPYTTNAYELVDAAVNWAVGRETIVLPALEISLSGSNLQISWPEAGSTGFTLQSTSQLSPAGAWAPVTQAPSLVAGRYVVTLPVTDTSTFFRLSK